MNKNKSFSQKKQPKKRPFYTILKFLLFINLIILVLLIVFDIHLPFSKNPAPLGIDFPENTVSENVASDEPTTSKEMDNANTILLPFESYAESIYLYDLDNESILYAKNVEQIRSPASLTKVMTAIVALENTPDLENTWLTYDKEMKDELLNYGLAEADIATFDFYEGEQIRMIDALYILMLRSSNDAANLIAENVAGSLTAFTEKMNEKAAEIGANQTHFANAHGLDAEDHYSTAYDLFLITRYAQQYPVFNEIVAASYYQIPASNLRKTVEIETYISIQDPAFETFEFYYPYVQGIKTGYTDDAGKCLISYAIKDGRHLLMILMGEPDNTPDGSKLSYYQFFSETKAFYEWAFQKLMSSS